MSTKTVKKSNVVKEGIYLTPAQINELCPYFGGSLLKDFDDLKTKLAQTQQLRFPEGITVQLSVEDLDQLKQQSIGMGVPYEQYLREFVEDSINLYLNGQVCTR